MSINKAYFIVNPHAAHGKVGKQWPRIIHYLRTEGIAVNADVTKSRWHAYHLAREAAKSGAQLIVSVGGEGTFNEIINGILSCTTQTKLLPEVAMMPIGTGMDLARILKIPKDYKRAFDVVRTGRTTLMDVGKVVFRTGKRAWHRYFANAFDVGLGGMVVRISNNTPKNLGGFLTFLLSSLVSLVIFKRLQLKIWIDKKHTDNGLMTILGALNGQYFGGGMHAAPMASPDDGVLEFIYVKDTNIFKFIVHVLAKVYTGTHLKYKNVYHCRGTELRVECNKICLMDVDGEEERAREVTVSVVPKAIKLRVP